jgi:hypothetical protein
MCRVMGGAVCRVMSGAVCRVMVLQSWCSIPYRAHPAGVNPNTPIATTTAVSATARIFTPNLVNGRLEVIITNQGFVIYTVIRNQRSGRKRPVLFIAHNIRFIDLCVLLVIESVYYAKPILPLLYRYNSSSLPCEWISHRVSGTQKRHEALIQAGLTTWCIGCCMYVLHVSPGILSVTFGSEAVFRVVCRSSPNFR